LGFTGCQSASGYAEDFSLWVHRSQKPSQASILLFLASALRGDVAAMTTWRRTPACVSDGCLNAKNVNGRLRNTKDNWQSDSKTIAPVPCSSSACQTKQGGSRCSRSAHHPPAASACSRNVLADKLHEFLRQDLHGQCSGDNVEVAELTLQAAGGGAHEQPTGFKKKKSGGVCGVC
jgi:hypothetical protein